MCNFKLSLCALAAVVICLPAARVCGDETTRQVQEELRRRHLYYNEIDGRVSDAFAAAIQRYQERKGFAATGKLDQQTLRSLGITNGSSVPDEGGDSLPDEPVLRSDAPVPSYPHTAQLVRSANDRPITSKEATDFVQHYVAACGSANNDEEISLYADRVDYYDHGVVDRQYVKNEVVTYAQRWPTRTYALISPVRLSTASGSPVAKFRVAFEVSNLSSTSNRRATGRTDDLLGLGRRADGNLEIVSLREQRVRRTSSSHRRDHTPPVLRSVRRVFRSIFH